MSTCRAAIDINGTDLSQSTKPPTKAQQFTASGIPFAWNADSPVACYFARRGFAVAEPQDISLLFFDTYWIETRRVAGKLRQELSLVAVGDRYRRAFADLVSSKSLGT